MFAILDCNNFYASCERVFAPKLIGKPLVILSNNDGCIIARSNEAKALGISMGMPLFKVPPALRQQLSIRSSNYALYGDMSQRVMTLIKQAHAQVEVYSIDEAFILLPDRQRHSALHAMNCLRQHIKQALGLPVSIGIAPTKTLAKVANRFAKQACPDGIHGLFAQSEIASLLANTAVGDLWGVGRRWQQRLHAQGIDNAAQLSACAPQDFKHLYNINMASLIRELRGEVCFPLEENAKAKQQIVVSRSFGHELTQLADIQSALANHVATACAKLRAQTHLCQQLSVFLLQNRFKTQQDNYGASASYRLTMPNNDTRVILQYAQACLQALFKPGIRYHKVGVVLSEFSTQHARQFDLWQDTQSPKASALMQTLDRINTRYGRNTVYIVKQRYQPPAVWQAQQHYKSPRYTTCWAELLSVV